MKESSEVTIKEVWPHLCAMGIIELRVNNRTIWSDFALDAFAEKDYYETIVNDYQNCAEAYLNDWYSNFRITAIDIKIVDFHHCVASIEGYFEE